MALPRLLQVRPKNLLHATQIHQRLRSTWIISPESKSFVPKVLPKSPTKTTEPAEPAETTDNRISKPVPKAVIAIAITTSTKTAIYAVPITIEAEAKSKPNSLAVAVAIAIQVFLIASFALITIADARLAVVLPLIISGLVEATEDVISKETNLILNYI